MKSQLTKVLIKGDEYSVIGAGSGQNLFVSDAWSIRPHPQNIMALLSQSRYCL